MALELKVLITPTNQSGFIFKETTGIYSAGNTTAWGAPNLEIGDITDATLAIYRPDTSTRLPSSTYVSIGSGEGFYNLFPNNSSSYQFDINGEMAGFGVGSKAIDGVYEFVYSVTDDISVVSTSVYVLQYATVQCCLAKMAVKAINSSGDCGCGKKSSTFERGMLMIEAAKYALICNNITAAAKAISHAIEICGGCHDC